ncbi:MAG: hypothetical protein HY093_02550 [Candidatus Liptonbacteria bacterium]|nr:hypothetical protein [Candidatus Liptonbacteria bacterium]
MSIENPFLPNDPENLEGEESKRQTSEKGSSFSKIVEFQRTKFGRAIKWLTLGSGIIAGTYVYDFIKGNQSQKTAWEGFIQQHPGVAEIKYDNLANVPDSEEKLIETERNFQYQLRIQEAIEEYRIGNPDTPNLHLLEAKLMEFNLGEYEEALKGMGLGSRIDLRYPFPALRFTPSTKGELGLTTTARYQITREESEADTIFIDPDNQDILGTIQHEYLHSLQTTTAVVSGEEKNIYDPSVIGLNETLSLSEGQNELLRLEINKKIKKMELPTNAYMGETFSAFALENIIGQDNFWEIIRKGETIKIKEMIDKKFGEGTFSLIVTGDGLMGLMSDHFISPKQGSAYKELERRGVPIEKILSAFQNEFGFTLENPNDFIITDENGQPFGIIKSFGSTTSLVFEDPKTRRYIGFSDNPALLEFSTFKNISEFLKTGDGATAIDEYQSAQNDEDRAKAKTKITGVVREYLEKLPIQEDSK